MDLWFLWVGLASLVALLVCSTLNVALRGSLRARLTERLEEIGGAGEIKRFVLLRHHYTLTTAIWRSAAVLALFISVLTYVQAAERAVSPGRLIWACVAAWALLLVFGVAIPYAWAKYAGDWLIVRFRWFLTGARWLSLPLLKALDAFDPLMRRLAGVPIEDAQAYADKFEEEILSAVSEGELHGVVDSEEKQMIESVIELGDLRVAEIMTPRTDIVAVPARETREGVLAVIRKQGHSRIPVFEDTIDTILGVLYVKDLLRHDDSAPFQLRQIMRKALFIPESKPVRELLREFQKSKVHIAVVLDEYGGTAGLITIEDILEEVFGELADEYEPAEPEPIRRIDDLTYEVDARVRIDELNERLSIEVPEHPDYETVGGYVFSTMGKIPKVGEHCERDSFALKVIGAEPRRVTRVLLKLTPPQDHRDGEI